MEVKIKIQHAYCATSEFEINGKRADIEDFGHGEDVDPGSAEEGGCGNRRFVPKASSYADEYEEKYGITSDEYEAVAAMLGVLLSFGNCNWCS